MSTNVMTARRLLLGCGHQGKKRHTLSVEMKHLVAALGEDHPLVVAVRQKLDAHYADCELRETKPTLSKHTVAVNREELQAALETVLAAAPEPVRSRETKVESQKQSKHPEAA